MRDRRGKYYEWSRKSKKSEQEKFNVEVNPSSQQLTHSTPAIKIISSSPQLLQPCPSFMNPSVDLEPIAHSSNLEQHSSNIEHYSSNFKEYSSHLERSHRYSSSPRQLLSTSPPSPKLRIHKNSRNAAKWKLPATIRRKFDRSRDKIRSSSILHEDSLDRVSTSTKAFEEQIKHTNPYARTFNAPVVSFAKFPPTAYESEVQEFLPYREPRYLDLFEPGVHVIRDPQLDVPRTTMRDKLQPLLSANFGTILTSKLTLAVFVIILVIIIGIVAIVTVAKLLRLPSDDPRVKPPFVFTASSCGLIKGIINGKSYVFRGVPYALAPLGKLRLRPAKVHNSIEECWVGNLTANTTKPCWKYDSEGDVVEGNEDCLYLDVFTPKLGYENPLPVIVYVGGMSLGSDDFRNKILINAHKVSVSRNVVIVSPQIRRGNLGFAPSQIISESVYPHTSGNQGVSDVFAALTWVQRNIEHFGGDRTRVLFLGHKAGAGLFWPVAHRARLKNLINSVWLTGASPVLPLRIWRNVPSSFSHPLNCSALTCITDARAKRLMESVDRERRKVNGKPWLVKDGVFVPMEEEYPHLPFVFGSTAQSSAERLSKYRYRLLTKSDLKSAVFDVLNEMLIMNEEPLLLRLNQWRQPKITFTMQDAENAVSKYSIFSKNPWQLLTTLISDALTTCPVLYKAVSMARKWDHSMPSSLEFKPPVHAYVSSHRRWTKLGSLADSLSDIEAIFNSFTLRSVSDQKYVKTMQNLFFTFLESGRIERHMSTSANVGIYIIDKGYRKERDRSLCEVWHNKTYFARRF